MMNDDDLLDILSEAARAERAREPADPRWDALADDALSAEDRAALEALAGSDPDAASALEAFRPLDASARERFANAALAELGATESPSEKAGHQADVDADALNTEPILEGARILSFPRRVATYVVPFAAAAGLLFFALQPTPSPFVDYTLSAGAGEQHLRGDAPSNVAVPVYGPGSTLQLVLRPATRVDDEVEVRAFILQGDELAPWSPPLQTAPGGAVRLQGAADALLPGRTGELTLVFAVGPAGTVSDKAHDVRSALDTPPEGWRVLRYRLRLR